MGKAAREEVRLDDGLASLAKAQLVEGSDVERSLGWQRFAAQAPWSKERTRFLWLLPAGAFVVGAALVMVLMNVQRPPEAAPISYTAMGARQPAADLLQVGEAGSAQIAFSEGSRVDLVSDSLLHVQSRDPLRPIVRLARGRALVSIRPERARRWLVNAGPFGVDVKGTRFSLAWDGEGQHLEVELYTGAIDVTGPLLEQGLAMTAGQRLSIDLRDRQLHVVPLAKPARPTETATAATPKREPSVEPAPEPEATRHRAASQGPLTQGAWVNLGWAARIDQSDAAGVLKDAEARGLSLVYARARPDDLWALADAARYMKRDDLTSQTLLAYRKRFPHAAQAASAAFFLGRRAEQAGQSERAAQWFDASLKEAPNGPFAAEALGRKLVIASRGGNVAERRALAQTYLQRFPSGSYASLARTLVAR